MMYGSLITGIILIVTGIAVKNHPDLIAGYNTLPKGKKDKIDVEKLTSITRKYLVLTGLSVLFSSLILALLNIDQQTQLYVVSGLVIVGVTTLIILSNRIPEKE